MIQKIFIFAGFISFASIASAQHHMMMSGSYGQYAMSREASGTAWVPESSPMDGYHSMNGPWMFMAHGYVSGVYDDQGGPRGDEKLFSESMFMGMASRSFEKGTLGFRSMLSLDPLMGKEGYPLLLQTGETADGVDHLIDRQHPHDLLMELAVSYSYFLTSNSSIYMYAAYPGEPALGPPTFMHRFSGIYNPEAPITHHWLDSTHVTFGVATLGYIVGNWKVEASSFTGREPDQFRWNFDKPRFDSFSGRITFNPGPNWSLQVSSGFLNSSEQLEPNVDQIRTTASAMYNRVFGKNNWQTTLALGQDDNRPGNRLNAALLESAVQLQNRHTFFGRAEYAQKDELFETGPLTGRTFNVSKYSLGYIHEMTFPEHFKIGLGGLGSVYLLPSDLDTSYGDHPISFMLFLRAAL